MSYDAKIDTSRLVGKKWRGKHLYSQCPACAAGGADTDMDNLRVDDVGNFACAANLGDRAHGGDILRLVGKKSRSDAAEYVPTRVKVPAYSEERKKAWMRSKWPELHEFTEEDIQAFAELRRLPVMGVRATARLGYLATCTYKGHRCWGIGEDSMVQIRRWDKGMIGTKSGDADRVYLAGSLGCNGFIGRHYLGGPSVKVLVLEGIAAMAEGVSAYEVVAPIDGWTIICAHSTGSRFQHDPEMLGKISGRFVRILADADERGQGEAAASAWRDELLEVGCTVDVVRLPLHIKDLGPLLAQSNDYILTLQNLFK